MQGRQWLRAAGPTPRKVVFLLLLMLTGCSQREIWPPDRDTSYRAALALITSMVALQSALLWHQHTRRAKVRQQLTLTSRRLAWTCSTVPVGLLELNLDGGRVWANEQFLQMIPAGSPVTLDLVLAAIHPDDRGALRAAINNVPRSREPLSYEIRPVGDEANCRWLRIILDGPSSRSPGRRAINLLAVDITERKRMEGLVTEQRRQLAHLARVSLLGELSSSLAHELKQPLTSILSNAEAAQYLLEATQLDIPEIREIREILSDIVRDDKRAGDLIQRMRGLLTRGEAELQRVDIEQLVQGALTLQHSDLVARNIRVAITIPSSAPAVLADPIELEQVLMNLVMNACEAMSSTPREDRVIAVVATVLEDSHEMRLTVTDRGRGIASSQLERIFDPFFSTKRGGLGVGLAICRSIITAHGGRLWATHAGASTGAAFHFTIPIFEEERHDHAISESISG
jgi:C4-dicarboxylate-specific signal transduction histidine kinase